MANPVLVPVTTFVGGMGVAQSSFATFSFTLTNNFEALIPIQINCPGTTSISAGATVYLYRSTDNGTTYETEPLVALGFKKPTTASQIQSSGFTVGPGWYLVTVNVGGGSASTWTAQQLQAQVITAYA